MRRLGSIAITLLLFGIPAIASAQTAADLQAQIAALNAQIAALQAAIASVAGFPTAAPSSNVVCPNITRVLQFGARGGDVANLQSFLAADPSIYPEGTVSAYFGALTERAVQRWQAAHGIVSSGDRFSTGYGVVGARTAAAMNSSCLGGSSTPSTGGPLIVTTQNAVQQSTPTITSTTITGAPSVSATKVTATTIDISFANIPPGSTLELVHQLGTTLATQNLPSGGTGTVQMPIPSAAISGIYVISAFDSHDSAIAQSSKFPIGAGLSTPTSPTVVGNAPTCSLVASPQFVATGANFTLSWQSNNATKMTGLPGLSEWPPNGQQVILVTAAGPRTYTLTFFGPGGSVTCSTSITSTVSTQPTAAFSITVPNSVAPGQTLGITWSTKNPPSGSAVRLELVDRNTGLALGVIATDLNPSGSNSWRFPLASDTCSSDVGAICGKDLDPAHVYAVQAKLYSPLGACWTNCTGTQKLTIHTSMLSSIFTVSIGNDISATIAQSSLISSTTRPFIVGTAYGVPSIVLTIANSGGVVYSSGQVPVVNTYWSVFAPWLATSTSYSVFVYTPNSTLLTSGTLQTGANLPSGALVLERNASNYSAGASMTATWNNQGTINDKDWITYVPVDGTWDAATWTGNAPRVYTNAARTGSATFAAPSVTGTFQIVYYSNNSFTEVGRSASFTVGGGGSTGGGGGTPSDPNYCSPEWVRLFGDGKCSND